MKTARRRLLRQAGALGVLAPVTQAWSQLPSACAPAPQCRLACGPTGSATAGPFYVTNAPETVDINTAKAAGKPMRIGGTVYREDGVTPVPGARVEIWHADAAGAYHPHGSGDISRYRRGDINLRGATRTDVAGRFAFTSIVPGQYGSRRRHIHWRISAPGHVPVTTQSYWVEERGTAIEKADRTDLGAEDCRWVAFKDEQGTAAGTFDVVLKTA
ncbi:protocatechuate 3,4-dioxygenase, beta subunit [Burkholderiaceae bacterium]|nr:protocatechuate 3,4-dioxygenase, beta subunit [Burkholderiaceae bacterium]